MNNLSNNRPRVGIALGGAAARSVFYIGLLEGLEEAGIPIDVITASSSGSIVAAAFAAGTLTELKNEIFSLDKASVFNLLEKNKAHTGMYSLDKVEEKIRQYTKGKHFNETQIQLAFVAVDINRGEQVVLSIGDIAKACRISCTVPGIFEAYPWGNRLLVDGGLLSVVPGDIARKAGVDLVIGASTRGTRHIFRKEHMRARLAYNVLKKVFLIEHAESLWDKLEKMWQESELFGLYKDTENIRYPGIFSVLGRSLDLAIAAEKQHPDTEELYGCDFIIQLPHKEFGIADFSKTQTLYYLGKKSAEDNIPRIKKLLNNAVAYADKT